MSGFRDETYLLGNEILLYRLATSKRGMWYCRFLNPTKATTYIRKSLKTSNKSLATKKAIDLYNDINAKVRLGAGVAETDWDLIFNSFVDELSPRRQELARQFNERYWKAYFGDKRKFPDFYKVNDVDLKSFWKWRIAFWRDSSCGDGRFAAKEKNKTSPTTLRLEGYTLKFFLVSAFHRSMIGNLPRVLYNHDNNSLVSKLPQAHRRGRFDTESLEVMRKWWRETRRKLNATADKPLIRPCAETSEWKKKKDDRVIYNHPYNRYSIALTYALTITTANTGIRPVEIVKLKWKDLDEPFTDDDGFEFTIIQIRREVSKVNKHRDVVARDFRETYDRLQEWKREWKRYFGRDPSPDDFVFANAKHKEQTRACKPHQSIRNLLMKLDIYKEEVEGVLVPRTLYSYRALYVQERLKNGMDAFTLARACGTSIEMIERYYDYNKNVQFRHDITRHYKTFEFSGAKNEEI